MAASGWLISCTMPPEIADWLGDFVNTHYKPAVRKKIKRNDPFAGQRQA